MTSSSSDDSRNSIGGEEAWVVEEILDVRTTRSGETEYLVRWEDYGPGDDSWEVTVNAPELLARFIDKRNIDRKEKRKTIIITIIELKLIISKQCCSLMIESPHMTKSLHRAFQRFPI